MKALALAALAGCNWFYGLDDTAVFNLDPRVIVIDNSASPEDLVDFPVLITLDDTRIVYADVTDPATQLRFVDESTGDDLPFEIERWAPDDVSAIWVRVGRVPARAPRHRILMHYGDDVQSSERPSDVWSGYSFVYHARDDRPASSVGDYRASATGATSGDGAIASATRFTGPSGQRVDFTNTARLLDAWDRFTVEMWLYADYATTDAITDYHVVWSKGTGIGAGVRRVPESPTLLELGTFAQFAGNTAGQPIFIPPRKWTHVAISFDGLVYWTFRDGVLADAESLLTPTSLAPNPATFVLGATTSVVHGLVDEVRISNRYYNGNWANAQYLSMTGRFVYFLRPGE